MSATDELRRLLDKRGVEWWDGEPYGAKAVTFFTVRGVRLRYVDYGDYCWLDYHEDAPLTPEQAIAATLCAGTCELDGYTDAAFRVVQAPDETDFIDYAEVCECTACGASVIVPHEYERVSCGRDELWPTYNYCPHCGAKVVSK